MAPLSRLLVDPIWKELRGTETLVIVPGGPLAFLPFEALSAPDGKSLVFGLRAVYAVSAGEWVRRRKEKGGGGRGGIQFLFGPGKGKPSVPWRLGSLLRRFGAVGGGALGKTGLSALEGAGPVFRGEAGLRKALAGRGAETPGILHFRVSALMDGDAPAASCLWLGPGKPNPRLSLWDRPDGMSSLGEIPVLGLDGAVAVLWEGRVGPAVAGTARRPEGLFCLVRSFLGGGARAVLLSDKPGPGKAAERFDELLWKELGRSRPGDALISAQRKWLEAAGKDPEFGDPSVWARFRLWE